MAKPLLMLRTQKHWAANTALELMTGMCSTRWSLFCHLELLWLIFVSSVFSVHAIHYLIFVLTLHCERLLKEKEYLLEVNSWTVELETCQQEKIPIVWLNQYWPLITWLELVTCQQELDPVTLHNQALMNMEATPTQVKSNKKKLVIYNVNSAFKVTSFHTQTTLSIYWSSSCFLFCFFFWRKTTSWTITMLFPVSPGKATPHFMLSVPLKLT